MSTFNYARLASCLLMFVFATFRLPAQKISFLDAHASTSFRGLSAPGAGVVWVSGSSGTIGRSTDAGLHWTWITVPGFEKHDFRDIQAFDSNTAVIMGIDTPAVILRTTDGGWHWNVVFRDDTPGMFLDAMEFDPNGAGMVVGDPMGKAPQARFYMAYTQDTGKTWAPVALANRPLADSGEGCFASSGTNITEGRSTNIVFHPFVSGGPRSRVFRIDEGEPLPLIQGATTTGANSIGIEGDNWVVVGGDFSHDTISAGNCAYSLDNGYHWLVPHTPPHGYRSCVLHLWDKTWLCCGTSGVDISTDGGDHWTLISTESFHVANYPGSGRTVFLAGGKGRVAKLVL